MRIVDFLVGTIIMISGIFILINKEFTIKGHYIFYGNWSYLVGSIVVIYGVYILYYNYKKSKNSTR